MSDEEPQKPAVQAISPISGTAPPVATRWRKGESGNPAGRPCAGSSWLEAVNRMAEWPEADVRAVAKDKSCPMVERAAARDVLRWVTTKTTRAGLPIANDVANRVLDRTIGKPLSTTVIADVTDRSNSAFRNVPPALLKQLVASMLTEVEITELLIEPTPTPALPEKASL